MKRCLSQADNLLLHDDGRVLLADFGATAQLERSEFLPEGMGLAPSNGSGGSLASISELDGSTHSSEGMTPAVQPICPS